MELWNEQECVFNLKATNPKCPVCTNIQFMIIDYIDAKLSTVDI